MMSFLLSIFGLLNILTVRVEWIFSEIEIQLGESINDYWLLPLAKLYIDDELIVDPMMYYERDGVERTFKSTINTNVVRTYILKYRVTFPTYSISHVEPIYFDVTDQIPPVITYIPLFYVPVGTKIPDLKNGLVYFDNYDDLSSLVVLVDTSRVVLSRIGEYPVTYQIRDTSGNITEQTIFLTIFDHLPPEINLKKEVIISYGMSLNWRDFFTVKDNYDLVPSVILNTSNVDFSTLGCYPFSITASDSSGLSIVLFQEVTIVDLTPPTIVLKSHPASIPVFSTLDEIDLYDYILYVADDYDFLTSSDVIIRHDIEFDTVGKYKIYFKLFDLSLNATEIIQNVLVADQTKPIISILIPFIFDVFSPEPHLIDHFVYSDNYTLVEEIIYKVTAIFKMNVVGSYPITIDVTDEFGNKASYHGYIEIVDRIDPVLTQLNDILITDFVQKDLSFYFSAIDNYYTTSRLIIEIDDHLVDYERIGSYLILITVTDPSMNTQTIEGEVIVVDIIPPVLKLSKTSQVIEVNSPNIVFSSYVDEISDNYDQLTLSDITVTEHIFYEVLGVYSVLFSLEDSSKNLTSITFFLTIDDRIPPSVEVSEITIIAGEVFNPLSGISVSENLEIYTISYFPSILDTTLPGTKTLTYVITDSRGNYTTVNRTIIVLPNQKQNSFVSYIPVSLITILGAVAFYYFWRKRP